MTDREKTAHILRRFGLGAGRYELARYEKGGPQAALGRLIADAKVVEEDVDPWEWTIDDEGETDPSSYRLPGWWALRMLTTRRPLQEKLALFWHDHFPVDAEKVGESPMMLGYLSVLWKHGLGRYRDLLAAVVKQGALLAYLDNNTSNRIHPNENLGRELLELFSLGRGNYTEEDVRSAARALTGWTLHYLGTGIEMDWAKLRKLATTRRLGLMNACFVPAIHDDGPKTFLGKTGPLDADGLIDAVARHPATAKFMCRKLWTFFAYPDPEEKVVLELAETWRKTDGQVEAVLRKMASMPEFWSERAVRGIVKCPVDWTVALFRSLDMGVVFDQLLGDSGKGKPIRKELRESGGGVAWMMGQQGLSLLYPPNVDGWDWGQSWLTAQNSVLRINHGDAIFWGGGEERPLAMWVVAKLKADARPTDPASLVDAVAELFDVPLTPEQRTVVTELCREHGGVEALGSKDSAANVLARVSKALFALPEAQLS